MSSPRRSERVKSERNSSPRAVKPEQSSSASSSPSSGSEEEPTQPLSYNDGVEGKAKQVVRAMLACERNKKAISQSDLMKMVGNEGGRQVQRIMERAKQMLSQVFGYEMVKMPANPPVHLTETAHSRKREMQAAQNNNESPYWGLVSTIKAEMRVRMYPSDDTNLGRDDHERGLLCFCLALLYLSGAMSLDGRPELEESQLSQHLQAFTPLVNLPPLLDKWRQQRYLTLVKRTVAMTDTVQSCYAVGGRALMECGPRQTAAILGDWIRRFSIAGAEELIARIERTLK